MKRLLIPDVSDKQRQKLQQKGIPFADSTAIGRTEIIVYAEFASQALRSLRRIVIREQAVSDDIMLLTTKTGTWNDSTWFTKISAEELAAVFGKKLTLDCWRAGWEKAYISSVESMLLAKLNSPVVIHGTVGIAAPIDDSNFHVFVCASPTGELRRAKTPKNMWGLEIYSATRHRKVFKFSGSGQRIRDDKGFIVAEVVGRNLYILFDIFYHNVPEQHKILCRILSEALKHFEALDQASQQNSYVPSVVPGINIREDDRRYIQFRDIAAEVLLPKINTDIVINRPRSGTAETMFETRLHIHLDSSSCGKEVGNPKRIFDHEVCGCNHVYLPGNGFVIRDQHGRAVAELVNGNNLYILHQLYSGDCYWHEDLSPTIFREVLELAVEEITITPSKRRYREKRRKILSLRNYIRLSEKRIAKAKSLLEKELPTIQCDIRNLQRKIASNRITDLIPIDVAKLSALPKVKNVQIGTVNRVHVFTEMIACKDMTTATRHELGEYRLDINLLGNEGCVRFFNLTRKVDGKHGPYVLASGETFKPNMQEIMPNLINRGAIDSLIMVCIGFLESVSPNDAEALVMLQKYPADTA